MQVTLKPISKRAKDRINSHGDTFEVMNEETTLASHRILVESVERTWRGEKWLGWFEVGKDVDIIG